MKHSGKVAMGLAGGLVLHISASAVTTDGQQNPYSAIVDRNVFNLKPAPVAVPVDPNPPQPASKITLLGIVSGFGPKQVMFKTPIGTPPKETSYALSENERAGEIEVLEINEQAGTVRLRNRDEEQNLSLEKDGMKPSAAAPPVPGLPGLPGRLPPPGQPTPPAMPVTSGIPSPTGGGSKVTTFGSGATTPARPLRGQAANTAGNVGGLSSGRVASFGTGATTSNPTPQPQQPAMSTEAQVLMMEVNRELTKKQVAEGMLPPLPPTPLTPEGAK